MWRKERKEERKKRKKGRKKEKKRRGKSNEQRGKKEERKDQRSLFPLMYLFQRWDGTGMVDFRLIFLLESFHAPWTPFPVRAWMQLNKGCCWTKPNGV